MEDKLSQHLVAPIRNIGALPLLEVHYWDPGGMEFLNENGAGIQVIGGQIELRFDFGKRLFLSWTSIKGWEQYSLGASNESFFHLDSPNWDMTDSSVWRDLTGKKLSRAQVFGYDQKEKEPHMLTLQWDSGKRTSVANFHFESDFIPKFPYGDDLWIISGMINEEDFKSRLKLECLKDFDQ